jgi:hypothetical protein
VFALLPAYDEKQPCLKIRRGGQTMPLDHHEPGTWLGRPGGDYQLPPNFAAQAGLDARTYAGQVAAAIKAGRAFRQAFDSEPYEDQIYLLYADSHKLSSQTIVEPKGQNWLATVSSGQEPGDGRVSRESAMNSGNFDARRGAAVTLERDHGGLLADPRFSSFLRDNIKRLMSQAKNAEILAFAETHGSLRDELNRRGWVADASLKTTALDRIPAIASAMKAHVDYNYELLAGNKANPKFSGINFEAADRASTMIAAGNKLFEEGEADTAMALYSTGLAVREGAVPPTVLHRMAVRKLEQHQYSEAVEYGSRAEEAANRSDASLEERKLIGTNSALLGAAFEQTGSIRPAIKAYQKAAQHGSVEASKRLEALENKHMLQRRVEPEQSLHELPPSTPAQDVPIPAPKTDSKSPANQQSSLGQEVVPNNQARKTAPTPLSTEPGPAAAPNPSIVIPLPVAPLQHQPALPGGPHIEGPVRRPGIVPNPVSPAMPLPRRVPGQTLVPREQPSLRQPVVPRQLPTEPPLRRQQTIPNSPPPEAPLLQRQPGQTLVPREQPSLRQPVLPRQLPTEPPSRTQQPSSVSPQPRVLRQQPTPTLSPPEESTRHRPAVAAPLPNDEPVRRREVIPKELR